MKIDEWEATNDIRIAPWTVQLPLNQVRSKGRVKYVQESNRHNIFDIWKAICALLLWRYLHLLVIRQGAFRQFMKGLVLLSRSKMTLKLKKYDFKRSQRITGTRDSAWQLDDLDESYRRNTGTMISYNGINRKLILLFVVYLDSLCQTFCAQLHRSAGSSRKAPLTPLDATRDWNRTTQHDTTTRAFTTSHGIMETELMMYKNTDALDKQATCVLLQKQPKGPAMPTGHLARLLNKAGKPYETAHKEHLTVVSNVALLRLCSKLSDLK